jgi:hypothetical protein
MVNYRKSETHEKEQLRAVERTMVSRYPTVNETVNALRNHFNRGGAMGGQQENMGIEARRGLKGGRGAGLAANPARGGNQPIHGMGPSLVPNGMPTEASARHSAMSMSQIPGLVRAGRMEHAHGMQLMKQHQAHIDRYSEMKRSAAVSASKPRRGASFGSLSDGSDDPNMSGLLSSSAPSDIGAATAGDTDRSPLQQKTAGGRSQVPNSNSGWNRRGGPGY